ncbi:hypothetical protein HanRHA438_Chr09g0379571 [Helianthus annuus]|nr:hypothetical protein HanIR_Chr09g0397081 [Helianthus annuus]KAJ0886448.1 hypothetical protein HanRHA438_Chr09g0379571 [Helianthus annuus]
MKTVRLFLIVERTKSSKTGGDLGCCCRKQVRHTTKPVIVEKKQKTEERDRTGKIKPVKGRPLTRRKKESIDDCKTVVAGEEEPVIRRPPLESLFQRET